MTMTQYKIPTFRAMLLGTALFLSACGGGGGGGSDTTTPPPPPPPPQSQDTVFDDKAATARFLTQATFGADEDDIDGAMAVKSSDWIRSEFSKPPSLFLPYVQDFSDRDEPDYLKDQSPTFAFWQNSIKGDDQLRQRVAYALSQIFVISHGPSSSQLSQYQRTVGHYQDILVNGSFGNFRDLLEDVTYSPAMGVWLTYKSNRPADADTGRVPDENYAREVMQLFTIGVNELNNDGTLKLGADGEPIETYDNDDVTGLAKVFTGLALEGGRFGANLGNPNIPENARYSPMVAYDQWHSSAEKTFLGTTIPAGTDAETSIDTALDTLFNHPNVGPFIGRQMIQRLVMSNPSPAYVDRVATVFDTGRYTLPDQTTIGTGQRGDMQPFIAAILFDPEARDQSGAQDGKLKEPILRFTHFARAFDIGDMNPERIFTLWDTTDSLGQSPYKSPSVFNFYRPGHVPPGTQSGAAGMTVPEMQITHTSSVAGYANFVTYFAFGYQRFSDDLDVQNAMRPNYDEELPLATDPPQLVTHLADKLLAGEISGVLRARIETITNDIPLTDANNPDYDGREYRTAMAVTLIMTSPEYIVQK